MLLITNFKHSSLLISESGKEVEPTRTAVRKKNTVIGTEKGRYHTVSLCAIKQPIHYNERAVCLLVGVT